MTRSNIVKSIMNSVNPDEIVIASTGFISREVFRYDRDLNFYMMGSMGNALSIGLGIAMNVKQNVIVLNGDGAALMNLGSMVTAQSYGLKNLFHFVLNNRCHESTGGQRTLSNLVDFKSLYKNTIVFNMDKDDSTPPRITLKPEEITVRFKNAIKALGN